MKEYIVTKDILNIRSSASDARDDNFIGQLLAGETIHLTDDEIIGTIPKGGTTNIWKTDPLNRLVSLDGVRLKNYADRKTEFINDPYNQTFIDPQDPSNESKWKVNWGIVDLEIWKMWRDYNNQGDGVKVGIIDTGVHYLKNDLNGTVKKSISIAKNDDGTSDNNTEDLNPYHGSKSAGIIGANGQFVKTVFGVAPKCSINIYKATNGGFDAGEVILLIKQAIEDNVKIISMSFTCQDDSTLKSWIDYAQEQNIILIASAGDSNSNEKKYPASYFGCLSIGAYYIDASNERVIYKERSNHNDSLTFIAPGKDVLTVSTNELPAFHQETSAATAFVAGIFALLVSKAPSFSYQKLFQIINSNQITESVEKTSSRSDYEGYGILNVFKLMSLVKT